MTKSKSELAIREQNQELAEMCVSGIPEAARDLFRPPEVKLVQPITTGATLFDGSNAEEGTFYHTAKQTAAKEMPVTILGFRMARSHWVDTTGDGDPDTIACRSDDGIHSTEGKPCGTCPNSAWVEKTPPPCGLSFVFMCLDKDGDPFLLRAKGTSFNAARKFISTCVGARKPLFAYDVVLESKFIEGKRRKYYITVFRRGAVRDYEVVKKYAELAEHHLSDKVSYEENQEATTVETAGEVELEDTSTPTGKEDVPAKDIPF